ncbi:MAG: UDP-3-O-acyl-N-acetylglucosamine deacetylase, partial [Bacteroidales bacterium]|nr:UDP-3-O-acyl-N-acetylglucosamine deacetylase [Bacteroidales bacterium]
MLQHTLKRCYTFEGKGLHTGKYASLTIKPAPEDTGIIFKRTDISRHAIVHADARNVSGTERSTALTENDITVMTVEHVLSSLTGLGIDNAIIEVDNIEVPILDGSARKYSILISKDGLEEQSAERRYITLPEPLEIRDEQGGSFIRIEPSEEISYDIKVDFNSRVLGIQTAHWEPSMNYAHEIGPCRTFVFFHELEYLFKNNLVRGGDMDNAIVIVERSVTDKQLDNLSRLFDLPKLEITEGGYLNNLKLRFPNEC